MSSHSYETECPNCSKEMTSCQESKPIDYITSECVNCGFYVVARSGFMSLEDLNEARGHFDEQPIKELPKQDKSLFDSIPELYESMEGK